VEYPPPKNFLVALAEPALIVVTSRAMAFAVAGIFLGTVGGAGSAYPYGL